jgi:hypothetical protein
LRNAVFGWGQALLDANSVSRREFRGSTLVVRCTRSQGPRPILHAAKACFKASLENRMAGAGIAEIEAAIARIRG